MYETVERSEFPAVGITPVYPSPLTPSTRTRLYFNEMISIAPVRVTNVQRLRLLRIAAKVILSS